jgi:DNA-binding NtrC family response regulator
MNFFPKTISNRILIIDDEEDVLDFLQIFLSSLGWAATIAVSVNEAFSHLERNAYFMILTDIAMPEMDGYELVSTLREKKVPSIIAMMTGFGYNPKHTLIKINRAMKCEFFFKPFDRLKISEGVQDAWIQYHKGFLLPESQIDPVM